MTDIVYNKNGIPFDIDAIATDLNGKADRDLLNLSDTGNIQMAKASMPSDRHIDLTVGASGATYTAPANGWVLFTASGNGVIGVGQPEYIFNMSDGTYDNYFSVFIPVAKGTFNVMYNSVTNRMFRFYYAQGSESEAS